MLAFESFFVILLIALGITALFSRMKLPWVVALLVGGMVAGPHGVSWFETDTTLTFLANIGLVFLMFMAGIESRVTHIANLWKSITITSVLVGFIPAVVGFSVILAFGYSVSVAFLIGIIFISSSVALLIPQFYAHRIFHSPFGQTIIASAVIIDIISLVLLSTLLAGGFTIATLFIYLFIGLFIGLLAIALPYLRAFALPGQYAEEHDLYERELRFIIVILIGIVALFEFFGLHSIIAAFFAGLLLSNSIKSQLIKAKLHALSYGFFVPIFFVVVGASVNVGLLLESWQTIGLTVALVTSLVVSKFVAGSIAGKILGYTVLERSFMGISFIPQLSTTLAVAFLGFGAGILPLELLGAIIAIAVITPTIAPIIGDRIAPLLTNQHATRFIAEENRNSSDELIR